VSRMPHAVTATAGLALAHDARSRRSRTTVLGPPAGSSRGSVVALDRRRERVLMNGCGAGPVESRPPDGVRRGASAPGRRSCASALPSSAALGPYQGGATANGDPPRPGRKPSR
jgi:hypothetical protein